MAVEMQPIRLMTMKDISSAIIDWKTNGSSAPKPCLDANGEECEFVSKIGGCVAPTKTVYKDGGLLCPNPEKMGEKVIVEQLVATKPI